MALRHLIRLGLFPTFGFTFALNLQLLSEGALDKPYVEGLLVIARRNRRCHEIIPGLDS